MNADHDDFDDEQLRHYYERELEILRRDMRTFARRHPEAAARLSINSDGRSDDAGVERMVQSAAILHARHAAKIDDDYPELSEAVIERTYPQYLRPFPSCSLVQFDIAGMFDSLTEPICLARGTPLRAKTENFGFRTTYDVVLAPLAIARARYAPTPTAPPNVKLPSETDGMLSVSFLSTKPGFNLGIATPVTVRVHIAGQPPMVAALVDTLLQRTTAAYVEDQAGRWTRLPDVPLKAVGFGPEDWLFTDAKEPGRPFGLLGEYFAFAQRFHFVDVDFAALCAAAPGTELTLHLAVSGMPPSSRTAQQLTQLCADHLKLFCTPIVNLLRKEGLSLKYDAQSGAWPIQAQAEHDALTDVWSVDQVWTEQGDTLPSSAALMTRYPSNARPMWTLIRRASSLSANTGGMDLLRLEGPDGPVGEGSGLGLLKADVTCFNADQPRSLAIGAAEGDMRMEDNTSAAKKITLLCAPTAAVRLSRRSGALWRLIAQQSPHAIQLNRAGLAGIKQLLQQFAALSPPQARHIDGITGLRHRSVMTLVARAPQPAMVRGVEITLQIDEQLFIANSIAIFARVMERFFTPYVGPNSFIQLVVMSVSGAVIWRGEPITAWGELR